MLPLLYISSISELFKSHSQYSSSFAQVTDAKQVVVSGHINAESVRYFLIDFLHSDRKDDCANVLIFHPKEPDYDLKVVMQKHYQQVKYFKGSVMNSKDLKCIRITKASAAIILSPNYCLNSCK